jgi:hypothetical protein
MTSFSPCGGGTELPQPVEAKLFCALLYAEDLSLREVLGALQAEWGEIEFLGPQWPFSHTSYYHSEMGSPLFRRFLTFEKPQEQEALPRLKWKAKEMESRFARPGGRRRVNIDPGLLLPDKLVLASTKPAAHRPYLGHGIYADLTLLFHDGSYQALPWTYRDYASEEGRSIFNALRLRYRTQKRLSRGRGLRW